MSAIEQMMMGLMQPPQPPGPPGGLLGPQMTPSAPAPFPMPQAQPMPRVTAPQPKGLFARIKDNLSNIGAPGDASEYSGLLSSREIQGAKPGFLARLSSITPGAPTPGQQYHGQLDRMVQMKMLAEQIGAQRDAKTKQGMVERQRAAIGQMFPMKPGETPRDTVHRAFQTALELYRGGDLEGAKAGFSVLGSMSTVLGEPSPAASLKEVPGVGLVKINPDGTAKTVVASRDTSPTIVNATEGVFEQRPEGLFDVATGKKWTGGTIHPVAMQGGNTYVTGTDEKGNPTIFAGATRGDPKLVNTGVGAKETSTGYASIQKVVNGNKKQISVIVDALAELSKHEDAVGLKRGLGELPGMGNIGDSWNQRKDPAGVAARAQIANVGSLIIHDRSGAAVTVSEYPRLAPFVPKVTDTPAAIRIKLGKLRDGIEYETKLYEEGIQSGRIKTTDSAPSGSKPPSYEEWLKTQRTP